MEPENMTLPSNDFVHTWMENMLATHFFVLHQNVVIKFATKSHWATQKICTLISRKIIIFWVFLHYRFERHICPMRFYGATNLTTMFWCTTRNRVATRFFIPVLTKQPWTIRPVCQPANWTCGQNATVLD